MNWRKAKSTHCQKMLEAFWKSRENIWPAGCLKLLRNGSHGPFLLPIQSMYGLFTYIWLIFVANVGIYTIRILWVATAWSHQPLF